jgi:chorismate synthase
MKMEQDRVRFLGGIMEGKTIGSPLPMLVTNKNHEKWRGQEIDPFTTPRPGHVDLTAAVKYGYKDLRPGLERSSARETTMRVAVGAVCAHLLDQFGIKVGAYVTRIGPVAADLSSMSIERRLAGVDDSDVRCPEPVAAAAMRDEIRAAIEARDTLGGTIEVVATGLPVGLGSHVQWDRRLEARIAAALMSVQAMKGVEIGDGFGLAELRGTRAQDAMRLDGQRIVRPTNRAGGIEGGISTGQPIVVRAAMKPIATTLTPQDTVDLETGQETPTNYERSDFCPVPRAVIILEAVLAHVLADALLEKLGGDSLSEQLPRFRSLRAATLDDLTQAGNPVVFWPDEPGL